MSEVEWCVVFVIRVFSLFMILLNVPLDIARLTRGLPMSTKDTFAVAFWGTMFAAAMGWILP